MTYQELILDWALEYAKHGFHVFPMQDHAKAGILSNRQTGTNWGASNDPEEIEDRFRRTGANNIGVATGAGSGVVVVEGDIDDDVDGVAWLRERLEGVETVMSRSPSGSTHYWFRHPGFFVKTCAGKIAPGVDVRGDGGMMAVPPNDFGKGEYEWVRDPETGLAPLPEWLRETFEEWGQEREKAAQESREKTKAMVRLNDNDDLEGDVAEALLDETSPPEGYDEWLACVSAINARFGAQAAESWSAGGGGKYEAGEVLKRARGLPDLSWGVMVNLAKSQGVDIAGLREELRLKRMGYDERAIERTRAQAAARKAANDEKKRKYAAMKRRMKKGRRS